MNQLRKKKSQVSSDFDVTLKAVVKTVFHNEEGYDHFGDDEAFLEDLSVRRSIHRRSSISETIKDGLSKITLVARSSFSSRRSIEDKVYRISNANDKVTLEVLNELGRESVLIEQSSKRERFENGETEDKESSSRIASSDERNWKIPYYIKNLFSDKSSSGLPFESTSVETIPFGLCIIMENKNQFYINVIKYFSVDRIMAIIAKKKLLLKEEISLYYKNCRLEKHVTISSYGINSKSHVYMKILKKIKVYGNYLKKSHSATIYTSEKVSEVKTLFSKKVQIEPEFMELKYKDVALQNHKDIFLYDIKEGDKINISHFTKESSGRNSSEGSIPGIEVVQRYLRMTGALETCDCRERRLNAITSCILAILNKKSKKYDFSTLAEFGTNLHHRTCFKYNMRNKSYSTASEISQSNDSEISIEECIFAEIDRAEKDKIVIEESDLAFLCTAKNFKEFKHFLKQKIGTKCNLRSVALLYKYGMQLVIYTGAEENNPCVKRILHYIKLYFQKYFEKYIIDNGGMGALTLTTSDIED